MAFEPRYQGIVERVAFGGSGVTRQDDGCVVFVPGVLPGETIRYRITARHRTFVVGELLEVLKPSKDRIVPECPLMIQPRGLGPEAHPYCPGCSYGHAAYRRELALKQEQLEEVMARIGGIKDAVYGKPIGSPQPLHYRNKITLHTQKDRNETRFGYMGFDNKTVLDIPACPLAVPPVEALLKTLREKPGFFETLRHDMDVTLRWSERDGAVYWRGSAPSKESWLQETTSAGPLLVPREGFFQVNPWAAVKLFEAVQKLIRKIKARHFVDLYCGAGFFSLAAFKAGMKEGVGLDSDSGQIAAAAENARRHDMTGFTFQAAMAEHGLKPLLRDASSGATLLLVDPPRTGLEVGVTSVIAAAKPRDVIYVSCAADTLARDLGRLVGAGYELKQLQLVDMFSRTSHFETVAWLRAPAPA
jgi:23S rRNA (uracil1939-C5)-methyltransferase